MPGAEVVSLGRVTRTPLGRLAACLLTGVLTALLGSLAAPPSASASRPSSASASASVGASASATPLRVSIDTLTPSTVPAHGRVTIRGDITNTSDSTWTDLQVYMLTSAQPMRSPVELAAAAASDSAAEIGSRLTGTGLYDDIGDLAPGQHTSYVLSVSRRHLGISGEPGVYWFGVHVLGAENGGGRDSVADGRARTFVPLLPPRTPATDLALLLPLKEPVRRDRFGRLLQVAHWRRTLGPDGRLDRLLRLGSHALPGRPVTWVVDPAVLDAAESMAARNAPLNTGPTVTGPEGSSPDASASPTPAPSPSGSPSAFPSAQSEPVLPNAALDASSWVQGFQRQSPNHPVLTVPYGDLDVASVLRHRQEDVLSQAWRLSAATMGALRVAASPVVAPGDGYLPPVALHRLGPDAPVLLRDAAFPLGTGPVLERPRGGHVVLTDSAAGAGGAEPADRYSALAVRQRILSDAALHALSPDHSRPLVISTPDYWNPGPTWSQADFFGGLDVSWLRLVDVKGVVGTGSDGSTASQPLTYPARDRRREVPLANLLATEDLTHTGDVFAGVLTSNTTVDEDLAKAATLASGTAARGRPGLALRRARNTTRYVHEQLKRIEVEGPPFVTMSSGQGPIQITVVNGLDQEVTVAVRARTATPDLTIADSEPVTLGPGRRASIRLTAKARDIGVHTVTLVATDSAGNPLGSTTEFNIRTSQVGLVIWLIMAAGGAVLIVAITVRVFRRISRRRPSHGPLLSGGRR
jgi:hypothetical protein